MLERTREVVKYRDPEECVGRIHFYLVEEAQRSAIARAGQHRTLREHTYVHRMQQLLELVTQRLAKRGAG